MMAIALFTAGEILAQTVYRWVDDEGEVNYSHGVPPEHAERGYEILGPDGTVRKTVAPALSPEERAERREQQKREAERARAQRSQETRDQMLLATYNSEKEVLERMEMRMASINSQRTSIKTAIRLVESRFESLVNRAAQYTRDGQMVPDSLNESIDKARAELRRLRSDLEALDEREQNARETSLAELERYRELTDSSGDS